MDYLNSQIGPKFMNFIRRLNWGNFYLLRKDFKFDEVGYQYKISAQCL